MAAYVNNESESDLSGDELFDDIGAFDTINVTNEQRKILERQWRRLAGESDEENDFEGFQVSDVYVTPTFERWINTEVSRNVKTFEYITGPTRVFDGSASALEYFQLFYDDCLFENIARFTNLNAASKRAVNSGAAATGKWTDVTIDELKAYYGLLLLMDVMQYDRDEHYWSHNATHWLVGSKFGDVMSRDRFVQIKRYLHFSDDSNSPQHDKLHKVRYILNHCRTAFQNEYQPHREISVDEAMIPFKGRLSMKQYMKDKPVKFGIKLWVAADAITAYCHNFEVYVGKGAGIVNNDLGLASNVVIGLTQPIMMKGHVIYTDNFYTSPQLADYLYQLDTYLCGTVRSNRKGFPKELVASNSEARKLERGASKWMMCGPLLATSWKDNRMVYYISSFHSPVADTTMTAQRHNKDGTVTQLPATPTVLDYAQFMGGVDRLDQQTRLNKSKKTLRWYRKIENKLHEIALYNAYVIEGSVIEHSGTQKRKRDLLSFRLDVAHALIGTFRSKRACKRPRSDQHLNDQRLDEKAHWPTAAGGSDRLCVVCMRKHRNYLASHPGIPVKDNPFKRVKTTMACKKCDVPLCCNARNTCFQDWHTKVYYWQ